MTEREFPAGYFGIADTRVAAPSYLASYKRHLLRFIQELPQKASVLDVGCGSGKTIKLIRAVRPDVAVSGVDISDVSSHMPPGVEFVKGSVEHLPEFFQGRTFDAIICQHVIEHLLYPMGLMEGVQGLLKNGGKIFIETPNWTRTATPWAHFYFWNDYTHVRPFSRFGMERLLREHALIPEKIITLSSTTWFLPRQTNERSAKHVHASALAQYNQNLITRIFSRLVNPLVRDLLIAIAKK